ncbi:ABC transporter ATP-binding protein [Pseudodesulfovibrio mercurii]|uniref:ABC transporter ATP-binding protein n=1 Tax=Pseudodesulfovibrio mercurii TaxID=641491 RepID=UPI00167F93F4|nr:ABC transporter ATP-binding protein [Pseudodesulfovibrio mercurii]
MRNKGCGTLLSRVFLGRKPAYHEALKSLSLEIDDHEIVGVIGRNGAGKSTLLRLLSGIINPTSGTIRRQKDAKVVPLLSLGIGFHPELTGLENCRLSGLLMGLGKAELARRMDDIIEFADIGRFFHEPVKTYSSGMYARLAFSLATSVDPDVLLIDEVLGVGDAAFAQKCTGRINKLLKQGTTAIIVSHDLHFLMGNCSRMILLDKGQCVADGDPADVAGQYAKI